VLGYNTVQRADRVLTCFSSLGNKYFKKFNAELL